MLSLGSLLSSRKCYCACWIYENTEPVQPSVITQYFYFCIAEECFIYLVFNLKNLNVSIWIIEVKS